MKILYVDYEGQKGHVKYNEKMLGCFKKIGTIDFLAKAKYFENFDSNINVNKLIELDDKFYYTNTHNILYKYLYRIHNIKLFRYIKKVVKSGNYDFVFFSYIEPISFALFCRGIKTKCAFVDHLISYIYSNHIKRFFWHRIDKHYFACFFEEYILKHMVDNEKIKNKSYYLPHPICNWGTPKISYDDFCFAPSSSNDQLFVQYLIDNSDKLDKILKKKIIIKGKCSFESGKIIVFNSHLTNEEYENYFSHCFASIIPYSNDYNYRTSGVFYESLLFNKQSFIHKNNTLSELGKYNKDTISYFTSIDELVELINGFKYGDMGTYHKNLNKHTDEVIIDILENIIYGK